MSKCTSIVEELNNLNLNDDWFLTKTDRDGAKVYSVGHAYTVEYPKKAIYSEADFNKTITWKCEQTTIKCPGRARSIGLKPPMTVIKEHSHLPNFARFELLKSKENIKQRANIGTERPRKIILDSCKQMSDEAAAQLPSYQASL